MQVNIGEFKEITYFSAYFAGLMAADGCIHTENRCSIGQSGAVGARLIRQLRSKLAPKQKIYKKLTQSGKYQYSLYLSSKELVDFLYELNVSRRKSLIYKFPEKLPNEFYPYFLRGYFDGDGSLGYYWSGTTSYFTMSFVGTENFINSCVKIIPIKSKPRKLKANNCYELRFNGRKAKVLYKWLYSDTEQKITIISSKQEKYKKIEEKFIYTKSDKYDPLKEKFLVLRKEGLKPLKIAAELNIPFQTIYKWIKKYDNVGYTGISS